MSYLGPLMTPLMTYLGPLMTPLMTSLMTYECH